MTRSMHTLIALLVACATRQHASAFTTLQPHTRVNHAATTAATKLYVSSTQHHVDKTPSAVFGQPIDKDTMTRNRNLVHSVKSFIFDNLYTGTGVERCYARFYALETIARMPYFSYLSVLHFYETIGRWRQAKTLQVHFAEGWNELHHLLIMEELGGNNQWFDRFVAQHVAWFYFWMVATLYLANPTLAYNLNQAVEEEAYETYNNFLNTHQEYLKQQPAPQVAVDYYTGEDLYMFDSMHLDGKAQNKVEQRRPKCETLYDTFKNVRDDEMEHVKTMAYFQTHE